MRYKLVTTDASGTLFTVGYSDKYHEICESACKLSVLIKDRSVKVYSYSKKYQTWNEEAYYLNGQ